MRHPDEYRNYLILSVQNWSVHQLYTIYMICIVVGQFQGICLNKNLRSRKLSHLSVKYLHCWIDVKPCETINAAWIIKYNNHIDTDCQWLTPSRLLISTEVCTTPTSSVKMAPPMWHPEGSQVGRLKIYQRRSRVKSSKNKFVSIYLEYLVSNKNHLQGYTA